MSLKSYGVNHETTIESELDRITEEVEFLGYSILPSVITESELSVIREKVDAIYARQEEEFGRENLKKINELNVARCLLAYDDYFAGLALHEHVMPIVRHLLGNFVTLQLQNCILNHPQEQHHQSSWHRDLPYQEFTSSVPLAVNAFWCIDPFTKETGSTQLMPFSHQRNNLPSAEYVQKNAISLEAPAGSVVIFNSMVYHRAGNNTSSIIRRGINHVYTVPIIKPQIDFVSMLKNNVPTDPLLLQLLGFTSNPAASVMDFRSRRLKKDE